MSTATTTIDIGTVTNVSDDTVTVTNSGPVTGLPTGAATYVFYTNSVTQDYGWTGANNDIKEMQKAMQDFTTNDPAATERSGTVFWRSGLAQIL